MRDLIGLEGVGVESSVVLDDVKDILMDARFNIDSYDRGEGVLTARRNDLTLILLGLYRRVKVSLEASGDGGRSLRMEWGGGIAASGVSFLQGFLISLFFFRRDGIDDLLASVLIGLLFALFNMLLFIFLRIRLVKRIKRTLTTLKQGR